MSIHIHPRLYHWICAFVMLASFSALLPTPQVSAQAQKVVLSQYEVNDTLWIANWNQQESNNALKIESLIRMSLYSHSVFPVTQADDKDLYQRYIAKLGEGADSAEYRNSLPYDRLARAMFDAASDIPILNDTVNEAWQELSDSDYTKDEAIAKGVRSYWIDDSILQRQEGVLRAIREKIQYDPDFGKLYDEIFALELGVKTEGFDARKYLADHPDFDIPVQIRNSIRSDGSMEISLADLEELSRTEFGKINDSIADIQETLGTIDQQQGQLLDYMKDQELRQKYEKLVQQEALKHQLRLQAANSSVTIIATLAGFIDPAVGKQISTVGQAAIQIGESLNSWMHAVAGLNTLDKITSLSTVVMTGNVLSAVMNVVNLFGDTKTPEQMILEEIGKLRQQVDQLRTEMHSRFDRIDQELNTIYTTMNDRFNQIDVELGKINGRLDDIQTSLVAISLQLNRMERNNFEFIDASSRRPLLGAIDGALGYKQRTGVDMPYQPEFVDFESTFYTWATTNAFDALSAGPSVRDYSDAQVLAELSAYPLDTNLNYLNGWLSAHGLTPFASKRLPSPRDWTFASRAYADMGMDWPRHLQRINSQRQADLDAVGDDLQAALQHISTIQTANGPQGNTALFNGLSAYYTSKLNGMNSALQASEAGYLQEIQGQLQRGESFDMFGGIDQALSYQPADLSTLTCGGTKAGLATPSNIKRIIPNYNRVALADYLKISGMSICLTTDLVNGVEDCVTYPGDQLPTCVTFWSPQATLTVWASGVAVGSTTVTSGSGYLNPDAEQIIRAEWGYFKARFEDQLASAQAGAAPPELAATDTAVTNRLISYQQTLYSRVVNGLSSSTLQAPATELAGAKKLIDSFITLGFPQAIDSDDFLRSLLFSEQRMPDDQEVLAAYSAARATPQQLTANPRLALIDGGQQRRAALDELLARYLAAISAKTYSEENGMIANTRLDLHLATKFATKSSAPTTSQRVFLPLVKR